MDPIRVLLAGTDRLRRLGLQDLLARGPAILRGVEIGGSMPGSRWAKYIVLVSPCCLLLAACSGPTATTPATAGSGPVSTLAQQPTPPPTATATPSPAPTASAAPSPLPEPTAVAIPTAAAGLAPSRVVLFSRDDDLWRTDVAGKGEERLTVNRALNWRQWVTEWPTYWPLYARWRPAVVSPDGRWIAFSNGLILAEGGIVVVDLAGHVQTLLRQPGGAGTEWALSTIDWAPDSGSFAFVVREQHWNDSDLYSYDPQRRALQHLVNRRGPMAAMGSFVWSPDSRYIAFACCWQPAESYAQTGAVTGEVQRVEPVTTAGRILSVGGGHTHLCWTADGRVITTTEGAARCAGEPVPGTGTSPDGTRLASLQVPAGGGGFGVEPSTLVVRNVAGAGEGVELWRRELGFPATRVFWSPDGRYPLVDDDAQRSPIWRLRADGTGELEKISEDGYLVAAVPQWK